MTSSALRCHGHGTSSYSYSAATTLVSEVLTCLLLLFHDAVAGRSTSTCNDHNAAHSRVVATSCMKPCWCVTGSPGSTRCDSLNLTTLPPFDINHQPTLLNLTANRLTAWPPQSYRDHSDELALFEGIVCVRTLLLTSNSIAHIHPKTLVRMHRLRHLALDSNFIETLDNDTFTGLSGVELLDLSRNRIRFLPEMVFRDLEHLKVLMLAGNRLVTLRPTAFRTLFSLRSLDLSGNPIISLPGDLLAACRKLVEFSAAGTRIRHLEIDLFRYSSSLAVVDLSQCYQMAPPDVRLFTPLTSSSNFTVLRLASHACNCSHTNFRQLTNKLQESTQLFPVQLFCDDVDVSSSSSSLDAYCSATKSTFPNAGSPQWIAATQPPGSVSSREPLPYDPMLGWYTAAVLSGLLFAFIACVWLEKAEKKLMDACLHSRQKRKERNSPPICSLADDPLQRAAARLSIDAGKSHNSTARGSRCDRNEVDGNTRKTDNHHDHVGPTEI